MSGKFVRNKIIIESTVKFNQLRRVWQRTIKMTGYSLHATKGWKKVGRPKSMTEYSTHAIKPRDWREGTEEVFQ